MKNEIIDKNTFYVGESSASAVKKLSEADFDHVSVREEKIFASKKISQSLLGYLELRVILEIKDEKIKSVWVKEFNHSI